MAVQIGTPPDHNSSYLTGCQPVWPDIKWSQSALFHTSQNKSALPACTLMYCHHETHTWTRDLHQRFKGTIPDRREVFVVPADLRWHNWANLLFFKATGSRTIPKVDEKITLRYKDMSNVKKKKKKYLYIYKIKSNHENTYILGSDVSSRKFTLYRIPKNVFSTRSQPAALLLVCLFLLFVFYSVFSVLVTDKCQEELGCHLYFITIQLFQIN